MNSGGVMVARVPRPVVDRGAVLVRVQYSLISVGTEIAPLRSSAQQAPDSSAVERGVEYAALARHYLKASLRDPKKAMDRVTRIARQQVKRVLPALVPGLGYDDLAIGGGALASVALERLLWGGDAVSQAERSRLRADLLSYCERDTLGLARLLERLRSLAGG